MFVVVPAAIVVLIGGMAYAAGGSRRGRRYRPGRPFDAQPVWFLAAPAPGGRAVAGRPGPSGRALTGARPSPALTRRGDVGREATPQGPTGGASDQW